MLYSHTKQQYNLIIIISPFSTNLNTLVFGEKLENPVISSKYYNLTFTANNYYVIININSVKMNMVK